MLMGYASRTGTKRNIAALKAAGWGWIVGPLDHMGKSLFEMHYALDNGAWSAFSQEKEWREDAFSRSVDRFGMNADFVVVPDVVADKDKSLELSRKWLPILAERSDLKRLLIAVQDGMHFSDISQFLERDSRVGIFIGGSTEWKVKAIRPWAGWARSNGLYCHVGRVNTVRRISICAAAGAHSFDGTSATRFVNTLPILDQARRQYDLSSCWGLETVNDQKSA